MSKGTRYYRLKFNQHEPKTGKDAKMILDYIYHRPCQMILDLSYAGMILYQTLSYTIQPGLDLCMPNPLVTLCLPDQRKH